MNRRAELLWATSVIAGVQIQLRELGDLIEKMLDEEDRAFEFARGMEKWQVEQEEAGVSSGLTTDGTAFTGADIASINLSQARLRPKRSWLGRKFDTLMELLLSL